VFQDVHRLAAGGGAGIENPHAGPGVEDARRQLRSGVLDGNQAFLEPGQVGNGHRVFKLNGRGCPGKRAACDTAASELFEVLRYARAT
jgi:hypothetical protein